MHIEGLSFVGDVFLKETIKSKIHFEEFVLNLEYAITKSNSPSRGKINLKSEQGFIKESFEKLPIAVNLANNHIFDFGQSGFDDTINYLDKNNIRYFGAGDLNNNYNNPLIVGISGIQYALLGYCCQSTSPDNSTDRKSHVALLELSKIRNDIDLAKNLGSHHVIINLHWGMEEIHYPKPEDVEIAKSIIEAGADLIIGHHAHVIQSMTRYLDKKIYFGLGNYIFPDLEEPSYFNGRSFETTYRKKQLERNKKSLIISVSKGFKVTHYNAYFDGSKVSPETDSIIPRWLPSPFLFKFYLWWWYRFNLVKKFMVNPKVPKIKHVRALILRK